jgi:hypothetical protein
MIHFHARDFEGLHHLFFGHLSAVLPVAQAGPYQYHGRGGSGPPSWVCGTRYSLCYAASETGRRILALESAFQFLL